MKKYVCLLLTVTLGLAGCSKKKPEADAGVADGGKRTGVSVGDEAPQAAQPTDGQPPPPPAPDAPAPDAPEAPAAAGGETLEGETALTDWSYALQDYVYRTKKFPADIAELATALRKPVPRAPAGYKIAIDKQNQRVVLAKTK